MNEYFSYCPLTGVIKLIKPRANLDKKNLGKELGSITDKGYLSIGFKGKYYLAHRLAWFLYYGDWPKNQIDHINRIKTDNRIENLREVSNRINSHNKPVFNGAFFQRSAGKWRAQIRINGVRKHLGYFDTEKDAQTAYQEKLGEIGESNAFGNF